MTYPPNSTPGAAGTAWTTGVQTPSPVVSPSPPGGGTAEIDPIVSPGDPGPRGDDVAATVAGAVAAAQARYHAHETAIAPEGSAYGTQLDLPPVPGASSKHTGPPPGYLD